MNEDRERLGPAEVQELVDALRRNLMYQTPTVKFDDAGNPAPHVTVRFYHDDLVDICRLCEKQGGWDISDEQKQQLHVARMTRLFAAVEGGEIDLTQMDAGSLMALSEDAEALEEGQAVADSCRAELRRRARDLN